jgi:hypothetical protein
MAQGYLTYRIAVYFGGFLLGDLAIPPLIAKFNARQHRTHCEHIG